MFAALSLAILVALSVIVARLATAWLDSQYGTAEPMAVPGRRTKR